MASISGAGLVAGLLLTLLSSPAPVAAQEFQWAGVWKGEFKATIQPQRDPAQRGNSGSLGNVGTIGNASGRDRLIEGAAKTKCEGTWTLTIEGRGEDLEGAGVIDQVCQVARRGTDKPPPERFFLLDIKIKDKGEGKDKEMDFNYRTALDRATICRARGKFKLKDEVFEGRYTCKKELRPSDMDGGRTLTISTRGEFKLTRGGT